MAEGNETAGSGLPASAPPFITVECAIENMYELHETVWTYATATIPAPPRRYPDESPEVFEQAYADWAYDHLYSLTGTGHVDGDSWYALTIVGCTDPALIGEQFEWGL